MLNEETLAAIKAAVSEGLNKTAGEIELKLEIQKRDLLKSQQELQQKVDLKLEEIKPLTKEELLAEVEKKFEKPKDSEEVSTSTTKSKKVDVEALQAQLRQDLTQEFEAKLAEDRKRVSAMEEELKTEKEKAQYTTLRNQAIGTIQQLKLVAPGKEARLLTLMEQEGLLTKTDEGFCIKSKNKFGDEIAVGLDESLPELLKTNYDEYLVSRPGTGTGGQPSKPVSTSTVDFSGMTAQQIYERSKDLDKDLVAKLEETYTQ